MFANRIGSSTDCSTWLPETSPPISYRGLLRHRFQSCNTSKIPAYGTQNQLWRRLPPLEDCRSGCVLHDRFSLPADPAKVATHPTKRVRTDLKGFSPGRVN